jgi:hypothetical protein
MASALHDLKACIVVQDKAWKKEHKLYDSQESSSDSSDSDTHLSEDSESDTHTVGENSESEDDD